MTFNLVKKYTLYFLILVHVSGAIGCFIRPGFFLPFTPLALLLTLFCFLIYQPFYKPTYILAFAAVALCGFILEVAGVKTGWIFGNYFYGKTLGLKIFAVPLLISANWALLINCGILMARYFTKKPLMIASLSASFVTLMDILIEQVACKLDYWCFSDGLAGVHNYVGWFIFSFAVSYFLKNALHTNQLKVALIIFSLQLLYFSALNLSAFYNFI